MARFLEKIEMKNQKIKSEKQKQKRSVVPLLTMFWASVVLVYRFKRFFPLFVGVINQIHLKNNKQHSYRIVIFLYYFIRYKSQ